MKESEEEDLRARGITLEKMFFLDYTVEESKTLRLFENREEINQITLKEGSPAAAEDEVVLERRYAEINGIRVDDKIEIGGHVFG